MGRQEWCGKALFLEIRATSIAETMIGFGEPVMYFHNKIVIFFIHVEGYMNV